MKKLLLLLLCFSGEITFGQQYDWRSLLAASNTMDQEAQQAARERLAAIIEKLTSEDASSVVPEIPGLVKELNGGDRRTRVSASAILMTTSTFRPDSQSVLIEALPSLERHLQDDDGKVRENCVIALAGLMPSIPPDVARSLADLLIANPTLKRSPLVTAQAMKGLQRVYGSDAIATNAIDQLINGNDQKKLLFLRSFGNGIHPNAAIIAQLGRLLNDPSLTVVSATLDAIGYAEFPAIPTLKPQLIDLEAQTKSSTLAHKAHDLLKVLSPPPTEEN